MKNRRAVVMALGCLVWASIGYADSNVSGNINVSLGQKFLNSDWEEDDLDLRNQGELGLLFDIRPTQWPVNLAVDILGSSKKDEGITGSTSELAFGIRKYFQEQTRVQPFVGGGLANVSAKLSQKVSGTTVSSEDSALGYWLMGGVQFKAAPHFNLGLNIRYSKATTEFFDEDVEAGGVHWGLFAGYGF